MESHKYCINVRPVPWKRPGLSHNRFYDAQANDRNAYRLFLEQQHGTLPPFSKAVQVDLIFYFQPPKQIKKRTGIPYHKTKPDADNLCKLILDCCKPIIWTDDCIVSVLNVTKLYDINPRTEMIITELE